MTIEELRDALREAITGLPGVVRVDQGYDEGSYILEQVETWYLTVHQHSGPVLEVAIIESGADNDNFTDEED